MRNKIKNVVYLVSVLLLVYVVINVDFFYLIQKLKTSPILIISSVFLVFLSQLTIGIIWSRTLKKYFNISFIVSFPLFLASIPAKYIPGKVISPMMRLESPKYKNIKSELFLNILVENFIIFFQNLIFGVYIYFEFINFFVYFVTINVIFFILFLCSRYSFKKFNFAYMKNIFLIEISTLLNISGILLAFIAFDISSPMKITLLYTFTLALSMIIFLIPAGIGARENLFVEIGNAFKFSNIITSGSSIFLRIIFIFSDIIFVFAQVFLKFFIASNKFLSKDS